MKKSLTEAIRGHKMELQTNGGELQWLTNTLTQKALPFTYTKQR